MKKKPIVALLYFGGAKEKILQIMKLMILCLAMSVFSAAGSVYSQKATFSMNYENISVGDILQDIENKSDFKFLYRVDLIDINRKVTLNSSDTSVEDLLGMIFPDNSASFRIFEDNLIAITSMPAGQQQLTVTGRVTDASTGEPLPSATIMILGTSTGVTTDIDGDFRLPVPGPEAVLVFSFVGYIPVETVVGERNRIDVSLQEDLRLLDEIVVVGYGTQRRSDITGSVTSLPQERLQDLPNINAAQALQGSLPGVSLLQTSAGANPGTSFLIRGRNSIKASNAPLVIIDGIPGSLNNVNPNDIESIEVLKDASAAAIYGSRGANGVVLITTKMGQSGKPVISYNGYYSIQQLDNLPDIMNGGEFYHFKQVRDPGAITAFDTQRYQSGDWTYWPDLAFRTGSTHNHNLSVSGATENTRYYIRAGIINVQGIAVNDNFTQTTSRINFDSDITSWLTFGTRTQLTYNDQSGSGPNMGAVFNTNPLGEAYDIDGNLTVFPIPYEPNHQNPLEPTLFEDVNKQYNVFTNNYLNIEFPFIKGLEYRLNTGFSIGYGDRAIYRGRNTLTGFVAGGSSFTNRSENSQLLIDNIISYNNEIGKHNSSGT